MHGRHGRRRFARLGLALAVALGACAGATAQAIRTAPGVGLTGRIAYGTVDGIWVMDADGTDRRQVTHTDPGKDEFDYDPAWSPDGRQLAFRSSRTRDGDGIMIVNVDGTDERDLAVLAGLPEGYGMAQASWWPNGKLIFTCSCPDSASGFSGVHTANPDGTGLTKLNDDGQYPDWSADGRIAYMGDHEAFHQLYVMEADGSGQTRLTHDAASYNVPDWSPDGDRIAFFSDRDGNEELYVMNADGTGVARVTRTPESDEEMPVWTPDGRIAFNDDRDGDGDLEWYLIDPDGSGEVELTQLTEQKATSFIDWLPGGDAGAPTTPPGTPPSGTPGAPASTPPRRSGRRP